MSVYVVPSEDIATLHMSIVVDTYVSIYQSVMHSWYQLAYVQSWASSIWHMYTHTPPDI